MTAIRTYVSLMTTLAWLSPAIVGAADQILLGKMIAVREGAAGGERSLVIVGREQATDVPAISDPRLAGATLTIVAAGATTTTESRALVLTGWTPVGTSGYRYALTTGTPSVRVAARRTAGGLAMVKVVVRGAGPVQPPNPGDEGGVLLAVAGGDRVLREARRGGGRNGEGRHRDPLEGGERLRRGRLPHPAAGLRQQRARGGRGVRWRRPVELLPRDVPTRLHL